MRLLKTLAMLTLVLSLPGCGQPADLAYAIKGKRSGETPFVAAPCLADRSIVYFYWPSSFMNALCWCYVSVDDEPFRLLQSRTYIWFDVTPGVHTVSATKHGLRDETLTAHTVDCEAGQATYVQAELRLGISHDAPRLKIVPTAKGEAAIVKTKQPGPRPKGSG